jgi:hypothetical protein
LFAQAARAQVGEMPLQVVAHLFGAGTVFIRPPPGPCSRRVRRRQANRHAAEPLIELETRGFTTAWLIKEMLRWM